MNWPNIREASTKRGLVWIVGGVWIVVQAVRGKAINSDELFNKLDFWLGIVMTIAGGFGLLPDRPTPTHADPSRSAVVRADDFNSRSDAGVSHADLPKIELVGRSTPDVAAETSGVSGRTGASSVSGASIDWLRDPVPSDRRPGSADPNTYPNLNPVGFGDRD